MRRQPSLAASAAATVRADYYSHKWISTDIVDGKRHLHIDTDDVILMLNSLGRQPCNIISIFGRARQGKSFLMNCLAGEREIFRISNEKESCTQGIDISNKWLSLTEFSDIDGGKRIAGNNLIGFIDAEGQGDKNVTYDATLVCPILLISKCVIFNWKGDLQKDHLLECLGIMTRAAQNVANEASSPTASEGHTQFSHLHIIFRDWQAVDSSSASVFSALFDREGIAESATRDRIRSEVLSIFASVRVWLFDAPTESAKALKSKLNIEMTTPAFRQQLRDLRACLSVQLKEPTKIAGQVLHGRNLGPIMHEFGRSLNSGNVVMPHSAFVNMITLELNQIRQRFEREIARIGEDHIQQLSKISPKEFILLESEFTSKFKRSVGAMVTDFEAECKLVIGEQHSGSIELLKTTESDANAGLLRHIETLSAHVTSSYRVEFSKWLRVRRQVAENQLQAELERLLLPELTYGRSKLKEIADKIVSDAIEYIGSSRYELSPEMKDSVQQLTMYAEQMCKKVYDEHEARIAKLVPRLMQVECNRLSGLIPAALKNLIDANPSGVATAQIEEHLNQQYIISLQTILEKAAEMGLDAAKIEEEFEVACVSMNSILKREYNEAVILAVDKAISKAVSYLESQLKAKISSNWEDSEASRLKFESELLALKEEAQNVATLNVSRWNIAGGISPMLEKLNIQFDQHILQIRSRRNDAIAKIREEAAKLEAARREQERIERERLARLERERVERIQAERQEVEERERLNRIELEKQARLERERLERIEAERKAAEERESKARLERQRAAEEKERNLRIERERQSQLEQERKQVEARRLQEQERVKLETEARRNSINETATSTPPKKAKSASLQEQLASAGKWFEANSRKSASSSSSTPGRSAASTAAGETLHEDTKVDVVAAAIEAQRRAEEERRQQAVKDAASWDKKKRGKK